MPECWNTDVRDTKYGAQQKCPNCGVWNKSGLDLPKECAWCSGKAISKPIKVKVYEKEPIEYGLMENEYTLDELWDEFEGLEDNIVRPLITIIRKQQLEIGKLKSTMANINNYITLGNGLIFTNKDLMYMEEEMQKLRDKLALIKSTINC